MLRFPPIAIALLAMGAGTESAPAAAADAIPSQLARAAAEYDVAQATGDRAKLERLLAPDYLLVNGGAQTEDKSQLIADFTDPAFKLQPYRVESPTAKVWRDGAILAGEVHLNGTNAGQPFAAHIRFVDVWRRNETAGWQVVFTQVTRFPAKP